MKKTTKLMAMLLSVMVIVSVFSIGASAVATELEAGSSKANATSIPEFGVDYVSSLDTAGEVDWFKFTTLSEDAYYHFYFENYSLANTNTNWESDSPNLYLYDANMKELKHSFTDRDKNDSFSLKLENSTEYYFKVLMGEGEKNSTGNYQITVSTQADTAPDTIDLAKPVALNSTVVSSFDGYADIDWYCFTSADEAKSYTITLLNYNLPNTSTNWDTDSPNLCLYDENMQEIAKCFTDRSKKGVVEVSLEADTAYYLKLFMGNNKKDAVGNYEFSVTCDGVKNLTSVSVKTMPNKTSYSIGESFDKSGLVINAEYSDGTSATVTNYTLSGFESSQAGAKTVMVSYTENGITKSASFTVNVISSSEDPDPAPGHQEENKNPDKNDADEPNAILGFFAAIRDFFFWLLDMLLGLIG